MKLFENLTNFANNTSIHGLVYIAKKSSSATKQITWFVLFLLSMIYAGNQIAEEVKCKFKIQYVHLTKSVLLRYHLTGK